MIPCKRCDFWNGYCQNIESEERRGTASLKKAVMTYSVTDDHNLDIQLRTAPDFACSEGRCGTEGPWQPIASLKPVLDKVYLTDSGLCVWAYGYDNGAFKHHTRWFVSDGWGGNILSDSDYGNQLANPTRWLEVPEL